MEITCPYCNFSKKMPKDRVPDNTSWVKCPQCKGFFKFNPLNQPSDFREEVTTQPSEIETGPGILKDFYQTFRSVFLSPGDLFRAMNKAGRLRGALAFGLLFGSMGTMFSAFWQFLVMQEAILELSGRFLKPSSLNLIFIGVLLIIPVYVSFNMFISGGIIHLFLFISRTDQAGFKGSFKVIAYSQATRVLALVPFLGGLVDWFWNLALVIIGLKNVHSTSYLRIIAVIVAFLLLKGIVLLPLAFIGSLIINGPSF